jgi:hypothetical protein
MIILALILVLVVALFLAAIVASAVGGERRELYAPIPKRTLPRAREPAKERQRTGETIRRQEKRVELRHAPSAEPATVFRAIGRMTSQETTDADANVAWEGFFTSANGPFKGGGRNDRQGAICFLTGQPKEICECAEHANRRRN